MSNEPVVKIPGHTIFGYSIIVTPKKREMVMWCSGCGDELGRFDLDDPDSRLPREWWRCPKGCNDEELQA